MSTFGCVGCRFRRSDCLPSMDGPQYVRKYTECLFKEEPTLPTQQNTPSEKRVLSKIGISVNGLKFEVER